MAARCPRDVRAMAARREQDLQHLLRPDAAQVRWAEVVAADLLDAGASAEEPVEDFSLSLASAWWAHS
jgi:hypothetical protein